MQITQLLYIVVRFIFNSVASLLIDKRAVNLAFYRKATKASAACAGGYLTVPIICPGAVI